MSEELEKIITRELLRDNCVYENGFLRCENSAEDLYWKLVH